MSLFLRVLGGFLLAMIATVAIVFFVSFRFVAERDAKAAALDQETVRELVQSSLQTNGADSFKAWLRQQEILPLGQTIYLVDRDEIDILNRRLPPEVRLGLRRLSRSPRMQRRVREITVSDPAGTPYLAMVGPAKPPAFGLLAMPGVHRNVLLLSLAVTALICLLLSRYLTAPIRGMTDVAERLAKGQLSARAGALAHRSDEIGTLARQFDAMADTLQSAVDRRDTLLRHISHELRSPLTRIDLALELADRQPESVDDQLARIAKESAAIEQITAQALTLIRAADRGVTQREVIDIEALCSEIAADARFEAEPRSLEVNVNHTTPGVTITADRRLLASALENVLRNALRYAPSGSVVDLSTALNNGTLVIEIRDRGTGVSPDALGRLFEPFHTSEADHHGLGLALTAHAIQAHGGTVAAENHPEGGLVVRLSLPAD
ncbi:MAG: ATP-binding protein [Pseudomonadota bacterium]